MVVAIDKSSETSNSFDMAVMDTNAAVNFMTRKTILRKECFS